MYTRINTSRKEDNIMLQMIFDLVEKIVVWADASAEAQQIVLEIFDFLLGLAG